MPHQSPSSLPSHRFDWKALGYLTSIAGVLFLGAVAALKESPPWWYYPALIVGMLTSICGMGFRYMSHLDEQHEIRKAEAEAKNEKRDRPRRRRDSA